jgi:hypothetical protein
MKKLWKISVSVILASSLILAGPALAKPSKDDIVGKVTSVEGAKKLEVQRQGKGKWGKVAVEEPSFIKDHFKTDGSTSAAIDLFVGARVGIKKNSEIVLLTEGDAAVVEGTQIRKIQVKSGGVWAKFEKQDKPLTIQTKGGVMGIKGTEFTVDTDESGKTDIVLLEGSVDYKEDKENGKTYEMEPGQKLTQFEKDGETYTVKGEPSEVDKVVADVFAGVINIADIDSVQDVLNTNWGAIPSDVVNSGINALRQKTLDGLGIPPEIQSLVSSYVYDPSGYTNYVTNVLPSIPSYNSLFSIPGIPSVPGIRF